MSSLATLAATPFYGEGQSVLIPLVLYVAGMVAYAVFIFKFYRLVARRDIVELELPSYAAGRLENVKRIVLYGVQYLLAFPTLLIAWYLVFVFFLSLLSGGKSVDSVLLVSMAVISSARVAAYYHEKLAEDLAKMVPFAILGVFVIDGIEALSIDRVQTILRAIPDYWEMILLFWGFTVALEFVLRAATIARYRTVETSEDVAPTAAEKEEDGET